jgi:predicted transcriptional regulator
MKKARLGKAEWEILRYIVDHHPISVREVADYAAETHGLARTTILTVMERLRKKRYLTRRKIDGLYQYSPKESASEILEGMIKHFVDNMLHGAISPFVAYLSKSADVSEKDLDELKQLVKDLEKQHKE